METEVFDFMSLKEISMVASSGHSEEGSGKVPTRNRLMALAPRFKQRKVSAVWDFSLGYGRVVKPQSINLNK
ncbi:hypothetical protein J1N35_041570 [Gossypium stocksii]|uniref:Uncharacterized protein n=1 Tax=Gossypium stocksii TaxID=47602 RepID=A0A9D3UFQ9_9ROSI|nr:hypothetical protein J1N35_041570 [Gossypium stocksii]